MCEPADDWQCKFDESSEQGRGMNVDSSDVVNGFSFGTAAPESGENNFTFPSGPSVSEEDDEVTELKIRAFLDEKVFS